MRVTADRDLCIGAGQCVLAAPEIFDQDDDGLVVVVDSTPPESRLDAADEAALMCPARAISVTDG
ncbi:ferredoxin [Streptomyces sp. NPDC057307]|uniref:ferredoxin n=1 Tax=Streptomyces sp. NPDC057307 TaxID=3346096 RepID=UPI00362504BD